MDLVPLACDPVGTWCQNDVISMSFLRHVSAGEDVGPWEMLVCRKV